MNKHETGCLIVLFFVFPFLLYGIGQIPGLIIGVLLSSAGITDILLRKTEKAE